MYYITMRVLPTRIKRRSGWETDTRDTIYELIVPRKENGGQPLSSAVDRNRSSLCARCVFEENFRLNAGTGLPP